MAQTLHNASLKNSEHDRFKGDLLNLTRMMLGLRDPVTLGQRILSELAPLIDAQQGVVYVTAPNSPETTFELVATYAHSTSEYLPPTLRMGEGLVGQCAKEKRRILLDDVPSDAIRVNVIGPVAAANVIFLPVLFEGEVKAVFELASVKRFSDAHLLFLDQIIESLGSVFGAIDETRKREVLLVEAHSRMEELQRQQELLKEVNDRLELRAGNLQNSESLLKKQQEALQATNEALEEKAKLLSTRMQQVEEKNREVEFARAALEEKAEQLALSSKYKSEFLANMSHELRTPLNSLMILAKMLVDNPGNHLTPKQVQYAQLIHASGIDLLSLINDILDLAKIESGTVTLSVESLRLADTADFVEHTFRQIANDKKLAFSVVLASDLPAVIQTDEKRLQQILKNLLSNAIKFTEHGSVSLNIDLARDGWTPGHATLDVSEKVLSFSVTDTGIGIPADKQKIIFEPFQQADGTTSRQYGGTGLGLSISWELTRLLDGEICVVSKPGKGSTFTLYLPLAPRPLTARQNPQQPNQLAPATPLGVPSQGFPPPQPSRAGAVQPRPELRDDHKSIQAGDRVVLIVEDDKSLASVLVDLSREHGFKAVCAPDGKSALALAKELTPQAVTLDLKLPDMDGWAVLDLLKHDPDTRHIPVSIISVEDDLRRGLRMGAMGVMRKPATREMLHEVLTRTRQFVERKVKTLLLVDKEVPRRQTVAGALSEDAIRIVEVGSCKAALDIVAREPVDCLVVGPALQDGAATDLLRELAKDARAAEIPVVIYGPDGFSENEQNSLKKIAEVVTLKHARTLEAVLEETTLFLHQAISGLAVQKRDVLATLRRSSPELAGRQVLIVDDNIRNIRSLTSALEHHEMKVYNAENGKNGIETLRSNPDIEIILMDIMMPELDGFDTIRVIRNLPEFKNIPIIAITAKAMRGDRERCIEAGASDYISKPVNLEQLLSLLRVWLTL